MSEVGEVRDWWAEHPMTYGETHGETAYAEGAYEPGSREFFDRVDAEFHSWNTPLHGAEPFDRLFPYREFGASPRVLEVGCGMGTMAMHWARHGARITAVDLNPTAIERTRQRFELHGLQGDIRLADGRELPFEPGEFDYAYSWGVLHHSPSIEDSLAQLLRTVRPGGGYGVMVYHRRSLLHWYVTEYLEGFLHRERRFVDALGLASRYGDAAREEGNPHTWPMTKDELRALPRALLRRRRDPRARHRRRRRPEPGDARHRRLRPGCAQEAVGAALRVEPVGARPRALSRPCAG